MDPLAFATWALVVATAGLVGATLALAWYTRSMVAATARLAESSERLEREHARQFELSGPLPRVSYPQMARWEPDLVSPGKPFRLWVRFSVRNDGRSATTIQGAVVKLPGTPWANGLPLTFERGVPVDVPPQGATPVLEGHCTIWPDDIEKLLAGKKASTYAFTPAGKETEEVEFPVYPHTTN